jgi:hypothetical protein
LGSDFLSGKTTARSLRQDDSGLPFSGDPRRHHRDIALGLMHDPTGVEKREIAGRLLGR